MFTNFRQCYQVKLDHSKIRKMHFWMIQRAKKEVFGHFLEFGLLDRLDIADCDSTKCFPTFGNVTRSWRIIQRSQKCIFEWSKRPKKCEKVPKSRFQVTLWLLVGLIGLILRTLIDEMDANPVLLIKMQGFVRIYSWLASFCEKRQNWAKNEAFGCFLEFGWLECSAAKVY